MQALTLVCFFLSLALTESFLWAKKCPIEKYKSSKYFTGVPILVNKTFTDRVKSIETVAQKCKVHVYVKESYYQIPDPAAAVLIVDADLVVGHALRFELRDESNGLLCNKLCLSKNPDYLSDVQCFLKGIKSSGLTWSTSNPDIISDNTYYSNIHGYQALKVDVQTKCAKETFKRQLLRELRQMYEEQQESEGNNDDEEKKKK